jgi:hypothetical protein
MKKLVLFMMILSIGMVGFTSCVRSKKSCKTTHKKLKQMRKSGQIKM